MTETSARLSLPYLMAAQAQKHVTHNQALERLDALVQTVVQGMNATTPPLTPAEGEVWALGPGPVNAWAGQDNDLAIWSNGGWYFVTPQPGWRIAMGSELRIWDGSAWVIPDLPPLQNLPGIGINASSDVVNRLAISADATLLNHEGNGHQVKINKAATTDTGSLLFQTNWSGRAEMGTAGGDDFAVKVSGDGSTWFTALGADAGSGQVSLPNGAAVQAGLVVNAAITGTGVTQGATDDTAGRLLRVGDHGLGGAAPQVTAAGALDAIRVNQRVRVALADVTGVGGPAGAVEGVCDTQAFGAGNAYQEFREVSGGFRLFVRGWDGTAWTAWNRAATQITGAITGSGPAQEGAVLERGSSANGDYIRYADGTLICWAQSPVLTTDTQIGATDFYVTGTGHAWSFPAGFVAAPVVTATARVVSGTPSHQAMVSAATLDGTGCTVLMSAHGNGSTGTVLMQAVGRWA